MLQKQNKNSAIWNRPIVSLYYYHSEVLEILFKTSFPKLHFSQFLESTLTNRKIDSSEPSKAVFVGISTIPKKIVVLGNCWWNPKNFFERSLFSSFLLSYKFMRSTDASHFCLFFLWKCQHSAPPGISNFLRIDRLGPTLCLAGLIKLTVFSGQLSVI